MSMDRLQSPSACAAIGLVTAGWLLSMPTFAQSVPAAAASAAAAELTPIERAQRESDRVFKWILIHSDKPRKASGGRTDDKREERQEEKREDRPAVTARPKPVNHAPESASAGPSSRVEASGPSVRAPVSATAAAVKAVDALAGTDPLPSGEKQPAVPTPAETHAAMASPPREPVADAFDQVLKPISQAEPAFPPNLLRTLRKGEVRVGFTVLADGSVTDAAVVASSHPKLNAAALTAVAQWRFAPLHKPQPGVVSLGFDLD